MGDIHEQDVRGGGVLSVQEHLLGGAMGWASVPYCPCLGLPPPGSLHGLCLLCRDATQCHSACGHTALQKVAAATQLYSGQCVPGAGEFLFCIFSVFTIFIASCQGYFVFGRHACALEAFLGSTAGTAEGVWAGGKGHCARIATRDQAVGLEWVPKEGSGEKKFGALLVVGYKVVQTRSLTS